MHHGMVACLHTLSTMCCHLRYLQKHHAASGHAGLDQRVLQLIIDHAFARHAHAGGR